MFCISLFCCGAPFSAEPPGVSCFFGCRFVRFGAAVGGFFGWIPIVFCVLRCFAVVHRFQHNPLLTKIRHPFDRDLQPPEQPYSFSSFLKGWGGGASGCEFSCEGAALFQDTKGDVDR